MSQTIKTLRIAGKTWTVERVSEDVPMSSGDAGATLYFKQVIQIREGQHPETEADTLLHEVLHALDYNLHVGLNEAQVHSLATALHQVLLDNPEFAALLMGASFVAAEELDDQLSAGSDPSAPPVAPALN